MVWKPENYEDLFNDLVFYSQLIKALENRIDRPEPPKGRYYVRDAYDTILEKIKLPALLTENDKIRSVITYFKAELPRIWDKTSTLPATERNFINVLCSNAYRYTVNHYATRK